MDKHMVADTVFHKVWVMVLSPFDLDFSHISSGFLLFRPK